MRGGGGVGVGDQFESPVEIHSIFFGVFFFFFFFLLHVLLFFPTVCGGGVHC